MITYYVAASMDGYIATENGGLEWLESAGKGGEGGDYGYSRFLANIDVIVMGRKTYDACIKFPQWPYPGKEVWVLTRQNGLVPKHNERFAVFNAGQWRMESDNGLVYLAGGGIAAKQFLEAKLVEKIILTTFPVLLGKGLPLFVGGYPSSQWSLQSSEHFKSGLIQATYLKNL